MNNNEGILFFGQSVEMASAWHINKTNEQIQNEVVLKGKCNG